MSSTESSTDSSPLEVRDLAVPEAKPSDPGVREDDQVFRGPEYFHAIGAGPEPGPGFDPLVHTDPYHPPLLYRLTHALVRWIVHHLFRTRVEGVANIPPPPFIIASNHQAWFDTAFLWAAFPKVPMIYTMARRDTVFNRRWKRWLAPKFGVFPIQPALGELDERGVHTVYQLLDRGGVVLIFPEGRYSRGRALRPLKKGVAHFALQAGVPIVPVALEGVDRLRLFGHITISIGPPIRPDPPAWWDANRRVQRMLERIRTSILRAFGRDRVRRPGWVRGLFGGLFRRRARALDAPPR
jgi:1-acyl-sn-glycerol-3-phosphate acyltransferase